MSAKETLLVVHRGCMKLKIRFPNRNKITFTLYSGWSTGSPFLPSKTHQIEILKENRIFCCKFSFKILKIVKKNLPSFFFSGRGRQETVTTVLSTGYYFNGPLQMRIKRRQNLFWDAHHCGCITTRTCFPSFFSKVTLFVTLNIKELHFFINMSSPKAKSFNFFPYF